MQFFISDEHYFNEPIVSHCKRPFESIQHMNEVLISSNNSTVGKNDQVFHIGDFTYSDATYEDIKYILSQLTGKHHLILGNHDELKPRQYVEAGFISVHTALWFEELIMVHDPAVFTFCKHELGILIHGHVHDLYHTISGKPVINVSAEMVDYTPISIEEVRDTFKD